MAKKKLARKKESASKKKPTVKKKPAVAKKLAAKKIPAAKRKPALKKKPVAKKKSSPKKKSTRARGKVQSRRGTASPIAIVSRRNLSAATGGQSGDTQGLSRQEYDDSESVEELVEEGQYREAAAVGGVENARDADQGEVRTTQFPEDDVPEEYLDAD